MAEDEDSHPKPVSLEYRIRGAPVPATEHPDIRRRHRAVGETWLFGLLAASMWASVIAGCSGLIRGGWAPGVVAVLLLVFVLGAAFTCLAAWRWASIDPPE